MTLNKSSCLWAYDFTGHRAWEAHRFRMLRILDEFTREAVAIGVERKLYVMDVIETLADRRVNPARIWPR